MYHDVNETTCHDNAIEQEEHSNSEEDDCECEETDGGGVQSEADQLEGLKKLKDL